MAIVYNATNEKQDVKIYGNWFSFQPKKMKSIEDRIASEIQLSKPEYGVVQLSSNFEDPEYVRTPEGLTEIKEAELRGVEAYVNFHRSIVYNNQVSLRQDLEKGNMKIDPASLASSGEIKSMEIVSKYQSAEKDREDQKIKHVKDLMKNIGDVKKGD